MSTMLDLIRKVASGELPPPPIATLIGFTLREVEPERAVVDFEADARHANPMGTVHGGILCDVADAAMGMAYASTGQLVARASSTCMTLRGASAAGR